MRDSGRKKYEDLKLLGSGGNARVWRAIEYDDSGLQKRPVALKVPHPALVMAEEDRKRFYQEARISMQLDHKGIVKVYGTTMVQGSPALVMQWVDGVNLRELQEKAKDKGTPRLSSETADRIVGDIAETLVYFHGHTVAGESAAVIHSDITQGNIMISSSGEVKLTDFGIAQFVRMADKTMSRAVGTERYMPPEQMRGRIYTATDVYGLGVVWTEILDGKPFHAGYSGEELQFRILSGHIPDLKRKGVNPRLDQLRRAMLSPDWRDRPRAEEVYTLIVEHSSNYGLAGIELKRLYLRCVGSSRSGFTGILDLHLLHGGDAGSFFASVFGHESGSSPAAAPSASVPPTQTEPPVVEVESDPDAPAFLRRPGRSSGAKTIEHTNTGGGIWTAEDGEPVSEPTVVLPLLEDAPVEVATVNDGPREEPVAEHPTVSDDPAELPQQRTLPFNPRALQPAVPAPRPFDGTPTPAGAPPAEPVQEQGTPTMDMVARGDSTEESPLVPEALAATKGTLAAGAAAFLSAGVFIASVVMTVADGREDPVAAAQPTQASPNEATSASQQPAAPETKPEPEAKPPAVEATDVESAVATNPDHRPADVNTQGEEPNEPSEADVEPDDVAPPIAERKPKSASKPSLEPAVTVSFLIVTAAPGESKAAEIKANSKRLTTDNGFKSTKLRPGKYKIQWRWAGGAWHELKGALHVESGLPSGSYYSANLDLDEMSVTKTLGDK